MSLTNHIQASILRYQYNIGYVRLGQVSSSNPANSTIKVIIQPEQTETGFIPYCTPWIGWFAPPSNGDQALVLFQEGDKNVPIGAMLLYWDGSVQPPANIVAGEAILHHSSGSLIKLTNDGKITINGNVEIDVTSPALNITTTNNVTVNAANINMTATGAINLTAPAINIGSSGGTLEPLIKSDSTFTVALKAD